jgi:hypothetical protein
MANVFISYAREDAPLAERISDMLRADGQSVFIDQGTLVAGEHFSGQIVRALTNAQAVVVLLSRNANRSKWVEEELRLALEKGHRVIPVLLDEDATKNWVWPLISDRNAVRAKSSAGIDEIARQVTHYVEQQAESPGLLFIAL